MKAISRFGLGVLACSFLYSTQVDGRTQEADIRRFDAPPTERQVQTEVERADRAAGRLTLGGRIGESTSEGYLDILQPLVGGQSALLFFNPKLSGNDDDESEWSIGLGGRVLLPKPELILGANVFYDERETSQNHRFDQIGAGLELLSTWIDARGNYYWPDDKRRVIASDSQISEQQSSQSWWGDIYARRYQLKQNRYTRVSTQTTTRYFDRYEAALEGYDLELGVRLPYLPGWLEARIFGGYYSFEGDFTEDIDGFRGRLEVRALPALVLDAELYENKELTGSDYFVGVRVDLPFDLWNLARGRNPFEGIGESARPTRREMRDRLSDMVMRDPHVRMHESGWIEDPSRMTVSRKSKTTSKGHVVLDDVNFVNNANQTGVEDGSAEHPWHLVQEGVDAAFGLKNVYVFQGIAPYDEHVMVEQNGVNLRGEGTAIPGFGGKIFGGGKYPVMSGVVDGKNGPAMTIAEDDVFITGFDFSRSAGGADMGLLDPFGFGSSLDRVGVLALNANRLLVDNSRFSGQEVGVEFLAMGIPEAAVIVQDSQFTSPASTNSVGIAALFHSVDSAYLEVADSSISGGSEGIWFSSRDGGDAEVYIENTDVSDTLNSGIDLTAFNLLGDFSAFLGGNRVVGAGDDGVSISLMNLNGGAHLEIQDNDMGGSFYSGLGIYMLNVSGDADINMINNVFPDNAFSGADLHLGYIVGDVNLVSVGNAGLRNEDGMHVAIDNIGGDVSTAFAYNRFEDNIFSGLDYIVDSVAGNYRGEFEGNIARDNGDEGLRVVADRVDGDVLLSFLNDYASGNGSDGLFVYGYSDAGNADLEAHNLYSYNNSGYGADLRMEAPSGDATIAVEDSRFHDNDDGGLRVDVSGGASALVSLSNIEAGSNGDHGIRVSIDSQGHAALQTHELVANNNEGAGLRVRSHSASNTFIMLDGGQFRQNGEVGARIVADADAELFFAAGDLAVNDNARAGLLLDLVGQSNAMALLSYIAATNNGRHGIAVEVQSGGGAYFSAQDILASDNARDGMVVEMQSDGMAFAVIHNGVFNENGWSGLMVDMVAERIAVGLVSDVVAQGNREGLTYEAQSVQEIAHVAVNRAELTDNIRAGGAIHVEAERDAVAILDSITASGNGRDGLQVEAQSDSGLSDAQLSNAVLNDNGRIGASLIAHSSSTNPADLATVSATGVINANGNSTGLLFAAESDFGQAVVNVSLVSPSTASSNTYHGIVGAAQGAHADVSMNFGTGRADDNGSWGAVGVAVGSLSRGVSISVDGSGNGSGDVVGVQQTSGVWRAYVP
ncbi:MAG: inverse autotransporter beta domain-containing protein [Verrucomicrobia bacterium]|nr:inverse autotransporter beta domain-containing protein [Verrucomicrobiota bacterium]